MDSGALREAVWDLFAADSGNGGIYDAVSGRMAYQRVPTEDWDRPYVVFAFVSGVLERTFGDVYDEVRVSFTCIDDNDQSGIDNVGKKLRALFDDATLTVAGAELAHITTDRVLHVGPDWVPNEAGTEGDWRDVTDYMILVKEN